MGDHRDGSETPVHHIVIAPNQSLSALGLVAFYCGGVATSLTLATVLAWLGFWPILVFAVAEWIAVGICLRLVYRSGRYREIVTVSDDAVEVEKLGLDRAEVVNFQRHWASVETRAAGALRPSRLIIKSHGTTCEIGRCLTEEERRTLTARLKELIGPVNRTPDLAEPVSRPEQPG